MSNPNIPESRIKKIIMQEKQRVNRVHFNIDTDFLNSNGIIEILKDNYLYDDTNLNKIISRCLTACYIWQLISDFKGSNFQKAKKETSSEFLKRRINERYVVSEKFFNYLIPRYQNDKYMKWYFKNHTNSISPKVLFHLNDQDIEFARIDIVGTWRTQYVEGWKDTAT